MKQESYPCRCHGLATTDRSRLKRTSSALLGLDREPYQPTSPPSYDSTRTRRSPLTFRRRYRSSSYRSYDAAARRMARMWWGREFAAAACARDCQMQVARFRPEIGCGVPYQYKISCA